MTDRSYAVTDTGTITTDNGQVSIPIDPANADYVGYLTATGKTHEEMATEVAVVVATKAADDIRERDRQDVLRRSAKKKLIALGLTRAEFRSLFADPDPE